MKKGLSILLALTLLVSMLVPVPVFGTQGDVGQSTTITITGGVTTIGTYGQVLGGVLPTAANLDFTIDPMNLAGLAIGAIVDTDARNNAVTFENNLLRTWNTSSVPVLLTAQLSVTGDASPVLNEAGVTSGDTAAVLMWMQPNATIQTTATAPFNGASQVIPFAATPVNAQFRLPARAHNLHVVDNTVNPITVELQPAATAAAQYGTAFSFGGIINTRNDAAVAAWGNVTAIGVSATFSMQALTGATDIPAARAALYRTDGDVIIAEGMIASYGAGAYVAPTLIDVPEGGATGGGFDFTTSIGGDSGWVVITDVPAFVGAVINETWFAANHSMFWYTAGTQTLMINFTTAGAGEYEVWISTGNDATSRTVTVLVTN